MNHVLAKHVQPTWQVAVCVEAVGAQCGLRVSQGDGTHRRVVQAL